MLTGFAIRAIRFHQTAPNRINYFLVHQHEESAAFLWHPIIDRRFNFTCKGEIGSAICLRGMITEARRFAKPVNV